MRQLFAQALVIARRDFLAVVATPTFLLFLLAPLLMLGLGVVSGTGAASMARQASSNMRLVAIVSPSDAARLKRADGELRALYRRQDAPPPLVTIAPGPAPQTLFADAKTDTRAVLSGPLTAPEIAYVSPSSRHAEYLAELADRALRGERLSTPRIVETRIAAAPKANGGASGFGAVFGIFFLTLMLAGQSVGMLAEEKSSKVIEILAASVRLEAVFLGKLIGIFGVAVLFVTFWGTLITAGVRVLPAGTALTAFNPAVGLPMFFLLCAAYFTMQFMLLGAVFLGVGAQASTMREIQMLSLPVTIFQVLMFGITSAALGDPKSTLATFVQIFPFSSPFAMAARGASDAALWPHALALAWQALWVAIVIFIGAQLFRLGVLKSGGGWRGLLGMAPKRSLTSV